MFVLRRHIPVRARVPAPCAVATLVVLAGWIVAATAFASGVVGGGGALLPHTPGGDGTGSCASATPPAASRPVSTLAVQFVESMGSGGFNSSVSTIGNFVDLDAASGSIRDWNCGSITYDGHTGTDIGIDTFWDMDEGVAVLAAAAGTVTTAHDGEYDRRVSCDPIANNCGNHVYIVHADGSETRYCHMRKNSVRVTVGQPVAAGDTIGFVGSSGCSSGPHLHFEVRATAGGTVVDPFSGACQGNASRWIVQPSYPTALPFHVLSSGTTTLALTDSIADERPPVKTHVTLPSSVLTWLRVRSLAAGDNLTWKWYRNGNLQFQTGFTASSSYANSWWYYTTYLTDPGNWEVRVEYNGTTVVTNAFVGDNAPNQLPVIPAQTFSSACGFEDEFPNPDPDGSAFWYRVATPPLHGTFTLSRGRNRHWRYVPDAGFSGTDSVRVYAIDDEMATGPASTYTFQVTGSTLTIGASAGAGGTVSPSGSIALSCGADQTFSITPSGCGAVADVLVDGVSVGPRWSYTFYHVQSSHTLAATFTQGTRTITASAGANGSISPAGITVITCGTSATYTMTPAACYRVSSVFVDGGNVGPVTSYTFTNVQANHTISVSFVKATYTINSSAGPNGSISPSGNATVTCGTNKSYTMNTSGCYMVDDVLVDGASVGAVTSYTFTNVTAAHTIAVTFKLRTYVISASAGAGGAIAPSGAVAGNCLGSPAFTITPDTCYAVSDVVVDGASVGPVTSYAFGVITTAHTIAASFAPSPLVLLASAGAGGSISPSGSVAGSCHANQSFAIVPNPCHEIEDVTVDGVSVGPVTAYTFVNVTSSHTIDAIFALTSFAITATAGAGGTISPGGTSIVNCGASRAYTVTPASCRDVADVLVDGVSVGAVTAYTFTQVAANHTIAASFVLRSYSIAASAGVGGSIAPAGTIAVTCGGSQSFTIAADACYVIAGVTVDGASMGAVGSYAFTNVTAGHSIAATFAIVPYTINASAGAGGTIVPSGAVDVDCGSGRSFAISATPGFAIADVLVDGASIGPVASYAFTGVASGHTIAARFTDVAQPAVTVQSPNGGEVVPRGSNLTIGWLATDNVGVAAIDVSLSRTGAGGPFEALVTGAANTGSYAWVVTGLETQDAWVRVVASDTTHNSGQDLSNAAFSISGTVGVSPTAVTEFALGPIVPNPAAAVTSIRYALPVAARVRLTVVDVLGRECAHLVDGSRPAGRHNVELSTQALRLRGGVYFVRLVAGGHMLQRRIVVLGH